MKISIFGLGYVGCVTAACLAKNGHEVTAIDVNSSKVEMINNGRSPIIEEGLEDLIRDGRHHERLHATTDYAEAVSKTEVTLVCVGTPSNGNGSLDLSAVIGVSRQIGDVLKRKDANHCVVFRSTVLPGTVRNVLIPILNEWSDKSASREFDVCFNPEFLREGTSITDFYHPPFTVIGQETERGGAAVARLYKGVEGAIYSVTYEEAEMVKYTANIFHAVKVTFANEIGVVCKSLGIDSHRVMDLITVDTKLNISPAYLKPGFAFGGSCLPKDLRAILYKAKEMDLNTPLLTSVLPSNRSHLERAIDRILSFKHKRVGILGMSFKAGTDDLRESPFVSLIEVLIGKGFHLKIYDPDVMLARIFGANKSFIEREIPHISSLLCSDITEVIESSEIIVVCKADPRFVEGLTPYLVKKPVLDLARIAQDVSTMPETYEGICW